jgi:hypothetical protein
LEIRVVVDGVSGVTVVAVLEMEQYQVDSVGISQMPPDSVDRGLYLRLVVNTGRGSLTAYLNSRLLKRWPYKLLND